MTPLSALRRYGVRMLAPVAMAAALLSACGGGSSQVVAFKPERLVVLGDESSLLVNDGSNDGFKYGVNDRRGTTAGKCLLLPTFSQYLAAHYGFVFAECNPTAAAPKAVMLAKAGARAEGAGSGLASQIASISNLGANDLVSLMMGTNDVIAVYEQVRAGTLTDAAGVAEVQRLGGVMAAQVNALLATGARAMIVTLPDLGVSPYALAAQAAGDAKAVTRLTTLTYEFSARLRTEIDRTAYDGRNYGQVLADDVTAAMVRFPASFLSAPSNVTLAACASATPQACQIADTAADSTLAAGAGGNTHLWATDRLLGPVAHLQIGQQVVSRAVNNPF